jgi:hypothetical protein
MSLIGERGIRDMPKLSPATTQSLRLRRGLAEPCIQKRAHLIRYLTNNDEAMQLNRGEGGSFAHICAVRDNTMINSSKERYGEEKDVGGLAVGKKTGAAREDLVADHVRSKCSDLAMRTDGKICDDALNSEITCSSQSFSRHRSWTHRVWKRRE